MPISADPTVPDPASVHHTPAESPSTSMMDEAEEAADSQAGPSRPSFTIASAIPAGLLKYASGHRTVSGLFTPISEDTSLPTSPAALESIAASPSETSAAEEGPAVTSPAVASGQAFGASHTSGDDEDSPTTDSIPVSDPLVETNGDDRISSPSSPDNPIISVQSPDLGPTTTTELVDPHQPSSPGLEDEADVDADADGDIDPDYELNMSVHPTAQIIDASSTSPHGPTDNRLTPIPEAQAIPNIVVTEDDSSTHQDDQEETSLAYVRSLLTKHS